MNEHSAAMQKRLASHHGDDAWCLDPWGSKFNFERPEENFYNITRAGQMLAKVDRFQAQVRLSVARHSINVSKVLFHNAPEGLKNHFAMAGLLHDIEEAWVGDMPTPLKRLCPDFCRVSDCIKREAINAFWPAEAIGPYGEFAGDLLHWADREMCQIERNYYLPDSPLWPRSGDGMLAPLDVSDVMHDWPKHVDASDFLTRYDRLSMAMISELREAAPWTS